MGESYSSTEVVLVAELMKVVASAYLAVTDKQASEGKPIILFSITIEPVLISLFPIGFHFLTL